ncbi:two-component system response regulator RegA [Herbaspirillum sp. Sphag1AN]|uniref:response regulator transcription factor n=1 Tax=unclassified Herbaspirillum TaxID=2624150 RepID=UPI001614D6DE|nr:MULTISPECIES: response regulator transcription factor [unclassified Herbaspirillum]MBB3212000.1 two-component system response regulator RegA [Herbaspirillum sp. Sphag1AN]MBB3244166.1 two-component system response regulator RegA [Herbaspirillum sp. Sphag64]
MNNAFLILDDNEVFATTLARSLTRRGFSATIASCGEAALAAAAQIPFDYATIDLQLKHDSGLQWIAPLRRQLPQARLLVLTGYASIATTVQAIKAGADNYLAKPANLDSILSALAQSSASNDDGLFSEADAVTETIKLGVTATPLSVERLEWEHIQRILTEHQGNISSTARALNMHRRTLQRKLAKRPVAR